MIFMLDNHLIANNLGKVQLCLWMIEWGMLAREFLPIDLRMAFQIDKGDSLKTILFDRWGIV